MVYTWRYEVKNVYEAFFRYGSMVGIYSGLN